MNTNLTKGYIDYIVPLFVSFFSLWTGISPISSFTIS